MKKRYFDYLSLVLAGILYVFSVIKATLVPMHVPVRAWHMILFAIGAFLFYCLINTKIGRIVFLFATGVALCLVAYSVFKNGVSNISKTLAPVIELINVMIQVGTGYYDDTIPFSLLMRAVGVYSLIVSLPVYYFLVKYFRFYLLFTPGLVFFMTVWGLNRHVDEFSFFIFITVAIICYIRHLYLVNQKNSRKSKNTADNGIMIAYFVPAAVVVILLAVLIPVSQKPIEWPWLDEKIYTFWWDMQEKFLIDRYDTFSLAATGFGDPSRLGGPVYADNTPVLLVEAPTRVYLRGAVYDVYTGTGWEKTEKSSDTYLEDRVHDHMELSYGWKAASGDLRILTAEEFDEYLLELKYPTGGKHRYLENYVEFLKTQAKPRIVTKLFPEKEISVQHLNVRTKSLFTPLKMLMPITGLPSNMYNINESVEGIFQSDRRLRGGSTYRMDYLQPAYGMKELRNYFELSKPGLYTDFIELCEEIISVHEKQYSQSSLRQELANILENYKQLERHAEEIYRLYTNIPEGLPERVIELAKEVSAIGDTTYTKVKCLENYLKQNYNYTLNPPYPPLEQDFVDYFLFEGKEGYCAYFASALCVMTRAIGIPSRYVEGFLLPEKNYRDDRYQVTNQNAHAWVEVYLEGVGWVIFEPTPPMENALNYYVRLVETETSESGYVPDMFDEYDRGGPAPNIINPGFDINTSKTPISTKEAIYVSVIALVLVVIILNQLFIFARWIALHFIAPKKSIVMLYHYAVSLLSQAGSAIQPGQTPKDYAEVIDERYQFKSMSMSDMVELYYKVRFGSHEIDKKTIKSVISFVSEVKVKTGRNMYFVKRLLHRCLLFKG